MSDTKDVYETNVATKWSNMTRRGHKPLQKQDEPNINAIIKTMFPPSCHYNGFLVTHALMYVMYGYTLMISMNERVL